MNKIDLSVSLCGVKLRNPVVMASGTFGYGSETRDLCNPSKFGAIITKTLTLNPKSGNPPPRLAEVCSGLINAIGLQNIGIVRFIEEKWDSLKKLDTQVIVSIAGESATQYLRVAEILEQNNINLVELNLSCPNLDKNIICKDSNLVAKIIGLLKQKTKLKLIAKLSPNVEDIGQLAKIAESAGADALSLINTYPAMAIDIETQKPKLSNITGGLSGPAIKPIALYCVWEAAAAVKIPMIGGGGISSWEDAVEFMLAGAGCVSVGSANLLDPSAGRAVVGGLEGYLRRKKIRSIKEIIGKARLDVK
jgi:dihydroorotate dehydrogenase (NAD+) catalytic subunit